MSTCQEHHSRSTKSKESILVVEAIRAAHVVLYNSIWKDLAAKAVLNHVRHLNNAVGAFAYCRPVDTWTLVLCQILCCAGTKPLSAARHAVQRQIQACIACASYNGPSALKACRQSRTDIWFSGPSVAYDV